MPKIITLDEAGMQHIKYAFNKTRLSANEMADQTLENYVNEMVLVSDRYEDIRLLQSALEANVENPGRIIELKNATLSSLLFGLDTQEFFNANGDRERPLFAVNFADNHDFRVLLEKAGYETERVSVFIREDNDIKSQDNLKSPEVLMRDIYQAVDALRMEQSIDQAKDMILPVNTLPDTYTAHPKGVSEKGRKL